MIDPEKRSGTTASDTASVGVMLENTLHDIGIPACPSILTQIKCEMDKDEPDLRQLDRIICSDVGLSAGLIAISNSPYFGNRRRVRSVKEALQILGLGVAGRAVAGIALRNLFPATPQLERFWHASATVARLSGWLAQNIESSREVRSEDAYTFGLFRNCGMPVLMKRYGHTYDEVLKRADEEKVLSFVKVEESKFPTNHASVGALLSRNWWLPEEITLAIRHHHDHNMITLVADFHSGSEAVGLIAIAQLAEHLLQYHQPGSSHNFEWAKMGPVALGALGITPESVQDIYAPSKAIASATE